VEIKPRLSLLAGALVFWGLQAGFVWVGLLLAAIVVAAGVVKHHLSLTHREFARLWDVTVLVLVGAAVYQRQTASVSGSVLSFLQWLPMLLFPEHQPAAHILRVKTQRLTDIVKGKHPIAARRCDPLLGFVEQPLVFAALRKQIVLEANDRIF